MEKFYEQFDSYVNGELKGDELVAFEEAVKNNDKLMEDLTLYKTMDRTFREHYRNKDKVERLRKTLSSLNADFFEQEGQKAKVVRMQPRNRFLKWAVAAVVILLASFFIPRFFTAPAPSYADLMRMPSASFTEMGVDADQNILAKAEKAFNGKDYNQVINLLKPYVERHPDNVTTAFYLALANMETGHTQEAESALKTLSQGESVYATEAVWYLALLELKRGNEAAFRTYLKRIPEGSQHYEVARRYY